MRAVDMSSPHQWYSVARAIRRRIVYHTGPTNSGKTYEALQARHLHGHPEEGLGSRGGPKRLTLLQHGPRLGRTSLLLGVLPAHIKYKLRDLLSKAVLGWTH